ncbi:MAG: hypothetical protein IJ644_11015 [Oscillospiraceae bacterium]|nr:hypothetical protein [Oscillospiraceae bacterium]
MSYIIQNLKQFPVTFGTLTLYLSGYQLSGSSTLKETGASDGSSVLAGYWPQGIRLKLKGKLAPDVTPEQTVYALSQNLLSQRTLTLGTLSFQNARLCGYTVSDQQDTPELLLLFYCPENPTLIQGGNSP